MLFGTIVTALSVDIKGDGLFVDVDVDVRERGWGGIWGGAL